MHRIGPGVLALSVALVGGRAFPAGTGDEQGVQKVLDDWTATWNRHDVKSWSEIFTKDADFIVVTGKHLKGREEIFAYHDDLHRGPFKNRQIAAAWKDLRFVRPDVAIGHVAFRAWTPGDDSLNTTALATVTLTREEMRWSIAALHNSLLSGTNKPPASK